WRAVGVQLLPDPPQGFVVVDEVRGRRLHLHGDFRGGGYGRGSVEVVVHVPHSPGHRDVATVDVAVERVRCVVPPRGFGAHASPGVRDATGCGRHLTPPASESTDPVLYRPRSPRRARRTSQTPHQHRPPVPRGQHQATVPGDRHRGHTVPRTLQGRRGG